MEMERYGIVWRGDQPIARPLPDGYWTPWHPANAEIERLTTVLADRERYWKHVIRNYESTASSLRQVVAAQHQQITAMMPSCGKE